MVKFPQLHKWTR